MSELNLAAPPERDRQFVVQAIVVLVLAALPRFWAAWFDQGVFWPDEIFQSVEQAHRLAFGFGVVPWEFRLGARSWVFPGMVAGLLKVGALLGMTSGRSLMLLVKTAMASVSLLGVYLSMRLAYMLAGRRAALLAGAFGGFFSVSLLLGSRCSTEMASAPLLIGSYLLASRSGRARQLLAGGLVGLSIFLRYQNGLVALGIPAILVSERRYKDAIEFSAAVAILWLLGGLLDWYTWGHPFHAVRKYLYFNLMKSAKKYGAYPFTYYAKVAWSAAGPVVAVIVAGFLLSFRKAPKLASLVAVYVLLHCIVPHKEFRFLMPIVPLAFALAGAGLADAIERVRYNDALTFALAATCAAWMGFLATRLTWERMGFPSDRGARSPWHSGEGINRLLADLGGKADVCGVIVTGESFGWIGGYSYFHRDVDMFSQLGEAEEHAANYLIAPTNQAPLGGYREIDRVREFSLLRRDGGCAPAPPDYRRELPF
jgi:hypothetical protein